MTSQRPTQPTPSVVATHIEALNLTGLSFASRRLLGKDAKPVTNQFTMWARQDRKGLPGVTQALWAALAPLGIGRPRSPAAAVCEQVLRGRERDGALAMTAAADCAESGKAQFTPLPDARQDDLADTDRRKALVAAVKDYWRTVGLMYGEVRGPVIAGDLDAAVRHIRQSEAALRRLIEQVADLATAVAGQGHPDADGQQFADSRTAGQVGGAQTVDDLVDPQRTAVLASDTDAVTYAKDEDEYDEASLVAHRGGSDPVMARAEAFAQQRRIREEPEPERRPVEVLSRKPVRNHLILPVVFILAVVGLALYVIFSVLNAPNPLIR